MNNAYNNGSLCLFLNQGFSSCSLNGCRCDYPFSKAGCEIQCESIFKEKPEGVKGNRYKAIGIETKPLTKADVFKRVGIQKKGMLIADWFIPYSLIEAVGAPSVAIDNGIDMVKEKFDSAGCHYRYLRIYHNVEIIEQLLGIYIIGIC